MGKNIICMKKEVRVIAAASVVGHEEHSGPIGKYFDVYDGENDSFGQSTWESAESEMQRLAFAKAKKKCALADAELDMLLAGDLLNQCTGAGYGLLDYDIPYIGLYGACSTAAEGILLGSLLCSSVIGRCGVVSSSHNCSAERQYRFPLEYGGQRSPTSQWTVTGAGAYIISSCDGDFLTDSVIVSDVLPGCAMDFGINDVNNMGAAMAPAAADTLLRYFADGGTDTPDLILTGDLGVHGATIFKKLMAEGGYDISERYNDCGLMIYDIPSQDKHSGGSGCGCSAAVLASFVLQRMIEGAYRDVIFIGTGAMMSPMSLQQGKNIPAIAHLVHFRADDRRGKI